MDPWASNLHLRRVEPLPVPLLDEPSDDVPQIVHVDLPTPCNPLITVVVGSFFILTGLS
jgi:hypothetical protein